MLQVKILEKIFLLYLDLATFSTAAKHMPRLTKNSITNVKKLIKSIT